MQDFVIFAQHHWQLSFGLLLVLILLVILEFIKLRRKAKSINPQQAVNLINHQNAVVVDIRSSESFANGHILESISLTMKEMTDGKLNKIEKFRSKPIIVVCARGIEAAKATELLQQKGFQSHLLEGGITAWSQAGLPLVKD